MPGVFRRMRWRPYQRAALRRRSLVITAPGSTLAAGTASFVNSGPAGVSLTAGAATGGTPAYTYQWQRSTTSGSGFANLAGLTSLSATDTTAVAGTLYYYRVRATDSLAATAVSNEVTAQLYTGGAISGGGRRPQLRASGV